MVPELPTLDGVRHHFVDLPGLRMHVAEAGEGEPILLLHGFPQHWWEWRKVIPGLAGRHRVICPDLRGAGWTDAPRTGYRSDQLLADVLSLLDALEIARVRVVGHDWGALLGFQLCLAHPDRVQSFMSLATPHPWIRFDVRLLPIMWRLWFQVVIATPDLGPRLLGRGRQRLARHLLTHFNHNPEAWSEDDIELFLAPLRDPDHARAAGALYRGFIMREAARIIRGRYRGTRLRTPTLVLYGAEDPGTPAELLGGHEPYVDHLEVELVRGAGHFVADDRPDVVVERALV